MNTTIQLRFEAGETIEAVAADLKVPPQSLQSLYDNYEIRRLEAEIQARPSYQQLQWHRKLDAARQVLTGNSAELLNLISRYESGEFHTGIGMLRGQGQFFATSGRLLHNYVAAALTVVSHLESAAKHSAYRNANPTTYQERFEHDFKKHGLSQFVRHLRNKSLHEYFPEGSTASNFTAGGIEIGPVYISLKGGMNPEARVFFNEHKGFIDIRSMVTAYDRHIDDFMEWLIQADLHELGACYRGLQDDLLRLQVLADRLDRVTNLPYLARGYAGIASSQMDDA